MAEASHLPLQATPERRLRPALAREKLRPGLRLTVAVSGGADSVALLRLLAAERDSLGLVLQVAHMHHGIRGEAADQDAAFVQELSSQLGLEFVRRDADTPAAARAAGSGIEEAARELRYGWFRELLAAGEADAVATAHTLSDQAETVLHRLLRGAWTEGLSGIHPVVAAADLPGGGVGRPTGAVIRPLLGATRAEVVAWLQALGQPWREDLTNADLAYTRNRIRHRLLPELATYNPAIARQLAQVAALALDDQKYWEAEVARLLPALVLPGRPVRGGGRAGSTVPGERSLAIEIERLRGLAPALVRRLLRGAAGELGVALDFDQTLRLAALLDPSRTVASRREQLTAELHAERTPRELRLIFTDAMARHTPLGPGSEAVEIPIPGEGAALGWRLRCSLVGDPGPVSSATLRAARPTDLVRLRHSRGKPKRAKEVWERLGVAGAGRAGWPVLVWQEEIVWMRGVALEPTPISQALTVEAEALTADAQTSG